MKCDYCKEVITKIESYGQLGSGLITCEKNGCYKKAFTDKTFKAKMFRLRNSLLYQKVLCNQLGLKTFLFIAYFDIKEKRNKK